MRRANLLNVFSISEKDIFSNPHNNRIVFKDIDVNKLVFLAFFDVYFIGNNNYLEVNMSAHQAADYGENYLETERGRREGLPKLEAKKTRFNSESN